MDVLYYSNYCKHCKELLTITTKSSIKKNIYFICVDKRIKHNNAIYIVLETGKKIKMPDIVKSVPAMILFSRGNLLLEGNSIYNYIRNHEKQLSNNNDEPYAFSLNYNSFTSDTYSFVTTDPSEMNAKGNGGVSQMHNYVAIDYTDSITTPPENYVSTRITSNDENSMNKFIEQRENDIPKHNNPVSGSIV
tara:strand:+ start:11181 stop:11753 length:573 start_codon:yes stop_codon:yes gene_type:complete